MSYELYYAEDGTIHRREVPNQSNYNPPQYRVGNARVVAYYIITLVLSVILALLAYRIMEPLIFSVAGDEYGYNSFLITAAPIVLVIGSVVGNILYSITFGNTAAYNLGTYFLSAIFSVLGMVAICIVIALICAAFTIALYIIGIALMLGIVFGIVSSI